MNEEPKHSCIESLLMQHILLKVEPGDWDRNPLLWNFHNKTKEIGNPENIYFLALTETEIQGMIDQEVD